MYFFKILNTDNFNSFQIFFNEIFQVKLCRIYGQIVYTNYLTNKMINKIRKLIESIDSDINKFG